MRQADVAAIVRGSSDRAREINDGALNRLRIKCLEFDARVDVSRCASRLDVSRVLPGCVDVAAIVTRKPAMSAVTIALCSCAACAAGPSSVRCCGAAAPLMPCGGFDGFASSVSTGAIHR